MGSNDELDWGPIDRYYGRVFSRESVKRSNSLSKSQPLPARQDIKRYPVRLDDIPTVKRRQLIAELKRQNPDILDAKGHQFEVEEMISYRMSELGRAHWEAFEKVYPIIIIT